MGGALRGLQAAAELIQSVHAVPFEPHPCEPWAQESSPEISALPRKAEIREFVLQFPPAGRVFQTLQSHKGCLGGLAGGTKRGL